MSVNDPVITAIQNGHAAILVTGNYHDLTVAEDKIVYRPSYLPLLLNKGFVVIRFSRSRGITLPDLKQLDSERAKEIQARLRNAGLHSIMCKDRQGSSEEVIQFFRAIQRLFLASNNGGLRFAALIDYTENLAPSVQTAAAAADEHIFVAESIHSLGLSPALRKSGNKLICVVREGLQHPLLNDLHKITYDFPTQEVAEAFLRVALQKKDINGKPYYACLANDLDVRECARLICGLPLRHADRMLLEAKASKGKLSRSDVLAAKTKSILDTSEGTLALLSTDQTFDDIVGLMAAKQFFLQVAKLMQEGNPATPRAIALIGPPGTAKTTFAIILGKMVGANVVKFNEVQNMYVGESQRRMNLALALAPGLEPCILFVDEITEMVASRSNANFDSGVSQELLGMLFQFSARDDLRGKVLLLAASNVPERLDVAWHDRFIFVPFLELVPEEMRHLMRVKAKQINDSIELDIDAPEIIEACQLLHQKGVSPRRVYDILNHAQMFSKDGSLKPKTILEAAHKYTGPANPMAIAYSSLSAIALTSFVDYLPWSQNPSTYLYPWYLEGVVDKATGQLDRVELEKRRNEYRKAANL